MVLEVQIAVTFEGGGTWERGEGSHGIFAIPSSLKSALCVCFVAGNSASRMLVFWAVFPYLSHNSIKTPTWKYLLRVFFHGFFVIFVWCKSIKCVYVSPWRYYELSATSNWRHREAQIREWAGLR